MCNSYVGSIPIHFPSKVDLRSVRQNVRQKLHIFLHILFLVPKILKQLTDKPRQTSQPSSHLVRGHRGPFICLLVFFSVTTLQSPWLFVVPPPGGHLAPVLVIGSRLKTFFSVFAQNKGVYFHRNVKLIEARYPSGPNFGISWWDFFLYDTP